MAHASSVFDDFDTSWDEDIFNQAMDNLPPFELAQPSTARFVPATNDEIDKIRTERLAKSTQEKTKWAIRLFNSWFEEWKVRLDETLKVYKNVDEFNATDLNYCLKHFVIEVRKCNGEKYPPRTLKELVAAIQHYFNYSLRIPLSIFNDKEFIESREVLDGCMKMSAQEGNRKPVKRAAVISRDSEETLWNTGVFGRSNPKQVIDTLVYYFGLNFSLRACQEHRNLEFGPNSQIVLETDDEGNERLRYTERFSKNHRFGINESRKEPKVTYLYADPDESRCVVAVYKFYVEHRPETNGQSNCSAFYLTPINNPKSRVWFKASPIGVNTIAKTVSRLLGNLGDGKFYTNTSLRRTAKTRLMEAGISAALAKKKTGHFSSADETYIDASSSEKRMCIALSTKTGSGTGKQNVTPLANLVEPSISNENHIRQPSIEVEKDGTKVKIYL